MSASSLPDDRSSSDPHGTHAVGAVRACSVLDGMLVIYLVALLLTAILSRGQHRERCIWDLTVILLVQLSMLFVVRRRRSVASPPAVVAYRLVTWGSFQATYFVLRFLLPLANPNSLDEPLYRLDIRLFGVEPTLWMDQFVNSATTEWFAFFYFAYFPLLASFLFPILLFERREPIVSEFTLGLFMLFCIGHFFYFVVPGFGPYRHLADLYHHQLPNGRWYQMVIAAVSNGGAQKDIFPSMHTGAPTFLAMFAFRNRKSMPYRVVWAVVAFFAINIIGATLFLRWHYLVDVIAGFSLAAFCVWVCPRFVAVEHAHRARLGVGPSWPRLSRRGAKPPSADADCA